MYKAIRAEKKEQKEIKAYDKLNKVTRDMVGKQGGDHKQVLYRNDELVPGTPARNKTFKPKTIIKTKNTYTPDKKAAAEEEEETLGKQIEKTFDKFRDKIQKEKPNDYKDDKVYKEIKSIMQDYTREQKLERAEQKIKILEQENDFLKRVRFINKKQILAQSKTKPQNENSN